MKLVREIVQDLNKTKIRISREKVVKVKTTYLALFRQAMLQLHHKGIVSDPGWYDERELLVGLRLTGSSYSDRLGRVKLTPTMLLYATYQEEAGGVGSEGVLSVWDPENWESCVGTVSITRQIWLVAKLWEIVNELDKFYENLKFTNGKSAQFNHKKLTYVQGVIRNYGQENNEAVAEILADGNSVALCSYQELLWDYIYEDLLAEKLIDGAPELESESLFLKGITHGQERDLISLLDDKDMAFDGRFGYWLREWYREHVDNKQIMMGNYIKRLRNAWATELSASLAEMLKDYTIIDVSGEGFWVKLEDGVSIRQDCYLIGQYAFNSVTGELFPDEVRTSGACGEFVQAGIVDIGVEAYGTDLELTGCPVSFDGFGEYYDIYQLNEPLAIWGGKTLFKASEAELYDMVRNIMFFDDPKTIAEKMSDNGSHGPVYQE